MRRSRIILVISMLVSCDSYATEIDSSYFSLSFPSGWDIQHVERQGQLGAKIGNKMRDGYPSPWVVMEYCIEPSSSDENTVPVCKIKCPDDPFRDLHISGKSPKLSKTRKIVTGNQTKYFASSNDGRLGSALLMTSCGHGGIASITINPENDTPEVLKKHAETISAKGLNWNFLTGDKTKIFGMANKGFNLFVGQNPKIPGGFEHSGFFALIDKNGNIRCRKDEFGNPIIYYDGLEQKGVTEIKQDITKLLAE